jgi:integrase
MLTGLRTIELRASEWVDIDFDKGSGISLQSE